MKKYTHALAALTCVVALALGGTALLGHDDHGEHKGTAVKPLIAYDMVEKLGDQEARASLVEVTLEPGGSSAPHRHPGPVFGYVLEGEYEWAIDDKPVKVLKVGETFYEPTGVLHRVSRNPHKTGRTRVLAVVLHPRTEKELAQPESATK